MALVTAMSDRVADSKASLDTAGPSGMDGFAQRLLDLRRYAELLTGMAMGIQGGAVKVRKQAVRRRIFQPCMAQHACKGVCGNSVSGFDLDHR